MALGASVLTLAGGGVCANVIVHPVESTKPILSDPCQKAHGAMFVHLGLRQSSNTVVAI